MILELLAESNYDNNCQKGAFIFGKKSLDEIKNHNVIIWGTSIMSEKLTLMLNAHQITPYAYCDNNSIL